MNKRATHITIAALIAAALLTGCSQWFAPDFAAVRTDARNEMRWALDQLPEDVIIKWSERTQGTAAPCGSGTMFTGHWDIDVINGFDREAWLVELEKKYVKRGYDVQEDNSDDDHLAVRRSDHLMISVGTYEQRSGSPAISIISYSNCSSKPYDYKNHAYGQPVKPFASLSFSARNRHTIDASED